jgi:hypothetical protein
MNDERLSALELLSLVSELLKEVISDDIIHEFAIVKSRKIL